MRDLHACMHGPKMLSFMHASHSSELLYTLQIIVAMNISPCTKREVMELCPGLSVQFCY